MNRERRGHKTIEWTNKLNFLSGEYIGLLYEVGKTGSPKVGKTGRREVWKLVGVFFVTLVSSSCSLCHWILPFHLPNLNSRLSDFPTLEPSYFRSYRLSDFRTLTLSNLHTPDFPTFGLNSTTIVCQLRSYFLRFSQIQSKLTVHLPGHLNTLIKQQNYLTAPSPPSTWINTIMYGWAPGMA